MLQQQAPRGGATSAGTLARMAERFYVNSDLGPGPFTLDGPEAHHLATVRRLSPGDVVTLFNGDGREYPAEVRAIMKRAVDLHIISVEQPQREIGHRLEVAAPLPKGDRAQFLVEKLTELGATAFVPLSTARSVVQPRATKLDRLQRHVVEASKQCGRNVLMTVEPLVDWDSYCRRETLPERRLLAHLGRESLPVRGREDVAVAVGPEGGFTDDEVARGREAGWIVVGLGPLILRVETAAIVLAARCASLAP
jgi:16S rRNA (uracil1498-N3)-methyltransferase